MRRMLPLGLALLLLALAPGAGSHGAWAHCGMAETPLAPGPQGDADFYLVEHGAAGWWRLYQETNGIRYLQRGYGDDPCHEGVEPDLGHLLF